HLDAQAGSRITQSGVTITGGTINIAGTGTFVPTNSGSNFLSGTTLNGDITMTSLSSERMVNGLTLNGTANVDASSILDFQETQSTSGSGSIVLGAGANNRIGLDTTTTATVTFGSGILIHGQNGSIGGAVYIGGTRDVVSNGTIAADVAGGQIN